MSFTNRYIFIPSLRTLYLSVAFFLVSGLGTVTLLAQTREAIEGIDQLSDKLVDMSTIKLFAFITIVALLFSAWTYYMFCKTIFRIANELHERPCWYKVSQGEHR